MPDTPPTFDVSQIGIRLTSEEFQVNTVRLAQFAAAIDDENPRHLDGSVAPPIFPNILPMAIMMDALRSVTGAFCVHGAHDFYYHQPIAPGMRLVSAAAVHGVRKTSAGVAVVIKLSVEDHHRSPVSTQYFTGFAIGASIADSAGEPAPQHRAPQEIAASAPLGVMTSPMQADQTRRYADAARDYSDYTLDAEAARAKGFPQLLVHGMLTMAFASRALVKIACQGDSTRLKRLAGRFSDPVYLIPRQAITTRVWALGDHDRQRGLAYESYDSNGGIVIRHGLAEVAA